jgi:small basic protein (TIGR04137 family)
MSQHSSLRSKSKEAVNRSVLKRYERLKDLKEKEKWDEEQSVYALPKQKIVKFKVKKEKSADGTAKEGAEATAAATPGAGAKTAAPAAAAQKTAAKPEQKGKESKK